MKAAEIDDVELALVGYLQSGKTALAVGLYATSTAEFTITGEGEDTENYLRGRKAGMESGCWPDPTAEAELPELRYRFSYRDRGPVHIRFREYMGARVGNLERFTRDVLGDPRGVLILLNPGMASLRDARLRNQMLGQIKHIIAELGRPGRRCRYLALVVTAADLLTTSLRDFTDEFNAYKGELVNCLQTSVFANRWREFAVTVSGALAEPSRASLAADEANTARLPFLWLLDRLAADRVSTRMHRICKSILLTVVPLLALGLAGFAWRYFWQDRAAERELQALFDRHSVQLEAAMSHRDLARMNGECQALERAIDRLAAVTPRFAANADRLARLRERTGDLIVEGRLAWYPEEFVRIVRLLTRGSETGLTPDDANSRLDDLADFERQFAAFAPRRATDRARRERLEADWRTTREELVDSLEAAVGKWMNRRIAELAQQAPKQASAANCAEWRREIASWTSTRKEWQAERDRCLAAFDAKVSDWQRAYEKAQYNENFLVALNLAPDGVSAVHVFENYYSNHPESPHLRSAAAAVHQRLGREFARLRDQLYIEWSDRRETLSTAELKRTVKAGFNGLKELCTALARVRSEELRHSCWYELAMACRARGCGEGGTLKSCFPQIARVKRLDVKMDYADFQRNFVQLEVSGTLAAYEWDAGREEAVTMEKTEFCQASLKREDNREWRTVWSGTAAVQFNQWTSCRFEYMVTDINSTWGAKKVYRGGTAEIRFDRECRVEGQPVTPGGYWEFVRRLDTKRLTGDSNPEFAYRLYVEVEGQGLNDIWPKDTNFNAGEPRSISSAHP